MNTHLSQLQTIDFRPKYWIITLFYCISKLLVILTAVHPQKVGRKNTNSLAVVVTLSWYGKSFYSRKIWHNNHKVLKIWYRTNLECLSWWKVHRTHFKKLMHSLPVVKIPTHSCIYGITAWSLSGLLKAKVDADMYVPSILHAQWFLKAKEGRYFTIHSYGNVPIRYV